MSTHNTDLDDINNICSLVGEILELSFEIYSQTRNNSFLANLELIQSKATTIKNKAQRMENRLREYKSTIEALGFKRVKPKKRRSR